MYYAIQDWIAGLASTTDRNASKVWAKMKVELSTSGRQLPYLASNGKKYTMDFGTDRDLYLIAQRMRSTATRPNLEAIKVYLAKAGAFTDAVRRRPEALLDYGLVGPDEAIDAAIEMYRKQGKDDGWITARIIGKIKRHAFTSALKAAILDIRPWHYGAATNEVYKGLWGRTAQYLKKELELPKGASLRDHQPTLALTYQAIAEEVSAQRLGDKEEIEWEEARSVVQEVAEMIGKQAKATGEYLGVDLATGKPILPSSTEQ